jgi:hypothetical protein
MTQENTYTATAGEEVQIKTTRTIYLAVAETTEGARIMERAYADREMAEAAADALVADVRKNTEWEVEPQIEELEFIESSNIPSFSITPPQ